VRGTEFEATYRDNPSERVVAASPHLRLIADLSPLVDGHVLLLPVNHYLSFAAVLVDHVSEVDQFLSILLPKYVDTYGDVTVLEHGSATAMLGSACIHHAHLHLLPINGARVDDVMLRDGLQAQDLDGLGDLAEHAANDQPYFLRADARGARLYGVGTFRQSQYLRSAAAEVIGLAPGTYDWAVVVRKQVMRATFERLSAVLPARMLSS
jgi:diadenosine tetraphosphate (Ap4A) HIT family hydrolase